SSVGYFQFCNFASITDVTCMKMNEKKKKRYLISCSETMLPPPLVCLLSLILSTNAQSRSPLSLNSVARFYSQSSLSSIPAQNELTITIALCSSSSPRVFISNATNNAEEDDPGPDGGQDVYEILLQQGLGSFTGPFSSGGILAVD